MIRRRILVAMVVFVSFGVCGFALAQQGNHGQGERQRAGGQQRARSREQARPGGGQGGAQAQPRRREGARGQQAQPRQGARGQEARRPDAQGRRDDRAAGRRQGQGGSRRALPRVQQRSRSEERARLWQQQRGWAVGGSWPARGTWEQHRAQRWRLEHRTWSQRGGYGGYFVPADRFQVLFGVRHPFRLYTRPAIVDGYPRFWYGGYWWMMVDPWPEFWADTWYDADDVYIDFSDGYYLYDRRHPGVGLALTIAF